MFRFPQVVQKHTLGEVGTWTVIWWPVVSGIFLPKTIKIWLSVLKLQSTMSGIFSGTQCIVNTVGVYLQFFIQIFLVGRLWKTHVLRHWVRYHHLSSFFDFGTDWKAIHAKSTHRWKPGPLLFCTIPGVEQVFCWKQHAHSIPACYRTRYNNNTVLCIGCIAL